MSAEADELYSLLVPVADERLIVPVRQHPDVTAALPVLSLGATVASGPQSEQTVRILALDLLAAAEAHCCRRHRHRALLAQRLVAKGAFDDRAVCRWPE